MRDQIDALFSREMTRKEFLQHVGAALLIVLGISQLLNALGSKPKQERHVGYGHSAYGGAKR